MLNKLERKFGKYSVNHLMTYLIGLYVIGYLLTIGTKITNINFLSFMTLEPYYIIHGFQIWRIFTWIMIPETMNPLFFAIMLLLYYQLGNALENTWGTFRFNAYIFGGMIFTLIGSFILYGIYAAIEGPGAAIIGIGNYFSMQYINLSIFLAFAVCYPDMEILLYFIIPIKMKWMAVLYGVLMIYSVIASDWGGRVAIIASVLNFLLFFFGTRNYKRVDPRDIHRRHEYKRKVNEGRQNAGYHNAGGQISRHKCAICGRTELTNPELEFRFCSKCNGNYEYCQDHLFTHKHVK